LDRKVDRWPVSINVAMPTGLVVNELLTNALKHGFNSRDGGPYAACLYDGNGSTVTIADDGVGLPAGSEWPQPNKLSSLIVKSLRPNVGAKLEVHSAPGQALQVTVSFARSAGAVP
jgi:two-component sensor histidine kinase